MGKTSQIAAVIIAYNEQEHIARCIKSLVGVVDEIVVIDSYSIDKTVAVCASLQAKVVQVKWKGFAATKNEGNALANCNFILSIDADEELSVILQNAIKDQKKIGFDLNVVYKFNRLNNYCGQWIRHAGWYPDTKVRIFDKQNTQWYGEVHEHLVYNKPVSEKLLHGDLLHYSIKDKQDHIARIYKYNKLARKYPSRLVAYTSAILTFAKLYILKRGFLEGKLGYQLCLISAKAKIWR